MMHFQAYRLLLNLKVELVIVGMSGGVDSSVATLLLAKEVRICKDALCYLH